jgi:hypothetical protein
MSDFQQMIREVVQSVATEAARKAAQHVLAERQVLPRYLSPKQASQYLGVSIDALQLWRGQEQGPTYIRMNRSIRYKAEHLDSWMSGQTPGLDGIFVTGPFSNNDSGRQGEKV